jgi:hypothetical protein
MMRLTRRGRLLRTVAVVAVAVGIVTYLLLRSPVADRVGLRVLRPGPPCTLTLDAAEIEWSTDEAMTATTVAGVGTRIGATVNGVAAAVAQSLRADRAEPMTPQEARAVYRGLPDVAQPTPESVRIAEALLGHRDRALTCSVTIPSGLPRQDPEGIGLTPRADTVREAMRTVFGKQILGGFAPEGVDSGHVTGSAHYEGRAIDVFFRPVTVDNQRLGWQHAMWAVAHAEELAVDTVIFDRSLWSASRSGLGWRDYRYPGGETDNPVLLHEDHVHVDVVEPD